MALGPGEIRAGRRPLVILSIAGLRLGLGLCLAWPLASVIAASGVGARAEGDRALFEGGGYLLLEVLRVQGEALGAVLQGLLPLFALGLLLTAAANGVLLQALNDDEPAWLTRGLRRLPALGVLGLGTALAQLVVWLIGSSVLGGVPEAMMAPQRSTLLQAGVLLVTALVAGALGGLSDLTKASLYRHDASLLVALSRAWNSLKTSPIRRLFGWLPYAAVFLLAAAVGAWLTQQLDVSQRGATRAVAVLLVHQLVVVASVALRAAWYARALRQMATSG
jgi:hypothetical protein